MFNINVYIGFFPRKIHPLTNVLTVLKFTDPGSDQSHNLVYTDHMSMIFIGYDCKTHRLYFAIFLTNIWWNSNVFYS